MSELRAPYRRQRDDLMVAVDEIETLREDLSEPKAELPELREVCRTSIFPEMRRWSAELRGEVQPIDIKPLRRKAKSLRGLLRLVLGNRRAMRILIGNLMLRAALVLILLAKLGLVILVIWGAVKLGELFM